MKNLIMIFVCVLFFFNQLDAQSYGLDNADPSVFTKYKIPDTDLHSLWFNTNLNYNSTKNTFYILNDNSFHFNEQLDYTLSPQYYLLNQSDDKTFSLTANLTGSYHYSRNVIDEPIYYNNFHSKNTEANILLALNFNYAKYINTSDFFYNFGSNVNVTMYNYQTEDSIINNEQNNFNYKVQDYTLSAGIGWGRMRNVTPVVSAIRFQERLKQVNALDKDLDENTIEDLAQKFSQVNYYSEVYNRADKFFWKDVENILSKDGVTLNGLNQYFDSYLREVLDEVRFIRTEGFETSLNFQLNYNNSYYSNSTIYEQLYTILNGSLLYSHQLT